ncbi:hypothetical protein AAVH_40798, partial [Aphelenchoides avenae]
LRMSAGTRRLSAKLRSYYEAWMLEGDHQTTTAGNPRPPPPESYLQWSWMHGRRSSRT